MLIKTKLTKKSSTVTASGMWRTTESTTIHMGKEYAAIKASHRSVARMAAHKAAVDAWMTERNTDLIARLVQGGPTVCYWAVGYRLDHLPACND